MKIICQIRVYPTERQKRLIKEHLDCHRLLYNTVLENAEKSWEEKKEKIHDFDLIKTWVNHFRKTDSRFDSCNYSSLQQTVRRFNKARKAMINLRTRGKECKLRFKVEHRFNSVEYIYGDGFTIKKDRIKIKNIGEIKAFWHRNPKDPTRAILTRRGTSYYVSFVQDFHHDNIPNKPGLEKAIGIDLGVKTLATLSDGTKIDPPKFAKRDKKDLTKAHRNIHKFDKGTRDREKYKKVVCKISKRITNRRKNFNHQLSRRLVNKYDIICLEDLQAKGILTDTNQVNFAILDLGINQFKNFLSYKAEIAGKKVILVNPAYTTQTCFNCGNRQEMPLNIRTYSCSCGYHDDRDINAAKNILALGLQSVV